MNNKKVKLILSVISIFVIISSTTVISAIRTESTEELITKKNKFKDNSLKNRFSDFMNKTREIFAYLNISLRIAFIVFISPIVGLYKIIQYAFIENHFIQDLTSNIKDNPRNETLIILLAVMASPFIALKNIISYAFIENHFIRLLIQDFVNGLSYIMNNNQNT